MAGKTTTISIRATAQDKASRALKTMQATWNKVAKDLISADKKVQTQSAKSTKFQANRLTASQKVRFAMAKEAAGADKTARRILALNIKYERSVTQMRKLARAGKPIPAALTRQAQAAKDASAKLKRHGSIVRSLTGHFGKLGKAALIAIPIAATAAALATAVATFRAFVRVTREGVKQAMAFEKAIAEVMTIATDASFSIDSVKKATKELAIQFGTTPAMQAAAMYDAVSRGANTAAASVAIMTHANRLAISGVTDVKTAVAGLGNITNVYGKTNEDVAKTADMLQAGIQGGATTAAELAAQLGQVAMIARDSGVPLSELIAAIATITTKGVTTSMAVTQLRSALVGLKGEGRKVKDEAKRLTVEFSNLGMKAQGMITFLKSITENAKFNDKSLKRLFGSVEAVNAVMALVGSDGGKKFDENLRTVLESQGLVQKAQDTMMATFGFSIQRTEALGNAFLVTWGEATTGSNTARGAVKILNEFLENAIKIIGSPAGRAAIDQFFGTMASSTGTALIMLADLGDFIAKSAPVWAFTIEMAFKPLMLMLKFVTKSIALASAVGKKATEIWAKLGGESAPPPEAQTGWDKLSEAIKSSGAKLRALAEESKKTGDAERKAAIKAQKGYESAYQAALKARKKLAQEAIKTAKDQSSKEDAAEERSAARKKKLKEKEKEAEREAGRVRREQIAKTLSVQLAASGRFFDNYRARLDRENADLKALDDKLTEQAERNAERQKAQAGKIRDVMTRAYQTIRATAESTFFQIGETVDGEIMTWGRAFKDFFIGLGKAALNAAIEYAATVAIKMAADRMAAMNSIGSAAAETGAKSVAAHAGIPFVGLAIGLIAAGAGIVAALAFRDDVPKAQKPRTGYAAGGIVTGPPGLDRVPIWATAGEFVIPKATVDQIRSGRGPSTAGRYADGGLVTAQGGGGGAPINITLASQVPADRAQLRRMVREVIVPELKTIRALGAY